MDAYDELIAEIDAFLTRTGMTARALGVRAVGDGKFVARLRARANVTLATVGRVRAYIAAVDAAAADAATADADAGAPVVEP